MASVYCTKGTIKLARTKRVRCFSKINFREKKENRFHMQNAAECYKELLNNNLLQLDLIILDYVTKKSYTKAYVCKNFKYKTFLLNALQKKSEFVFKLQCSLQQKPFRF